MMPDITLSQSIRQNLLSLQNTADLFGRTQTRFSTGLKVNSALDNPNSFFTAEGLNNRANDLASLLDSIGQSVQTIKAADKGLTAIVELVEAAKAKANQAQQSNLITTRQKYAAEYNDLLRQMESIARDSGYSGKNLLGGGTGNDLQVVFNENNTSTLNIEAIDLTKASAVTGLPDLTVGTVSTATVSQADLLAGRESGDTLALSFAGKTFSISYGTGATADDIVGALDSIADVSASSDGTTVTITAAGGNFTLDDTDTTSDMTAVTGTGYVQGSFDQDSSVENTLSALTDSLNVLREHASKLSTGATVVGNRKDFTESMINTLRVGADLLTLADKDEEGANMLALQVRQQLASTSLSIASKAEQGVLRLFE